MLEASEQPALASGTSTLRVGFSNFAVYAFRGAQTSHRLSIQRTKSPEAEAPEGEGEGEHSSSRSYRTQRRGGKGLHDIKTTERNGNVVNVLSVTEESEVMIISQQGKITRLDSSTIRECGRSSQGVRLINLEEGDQVAAAGLINETSDEPPAQPLLIQ